MAKPGKSVGNQFFRAVARRLNIPWNSNTARLFKAWQSGEGTMATFNPLATTRDIGAGTNFNSVGVKNYPTFSAGVRATAETIGLGHYSGILQALRANKPANYIANNFQDEWSTWGTGSLVAARLGDTPAPSVQADDSRSVTPVKVKNKTNSDFGNAPDLQLARTSLIQTLLANNQKIAARELPDTMSYLTAFSQYRKAQMYEPPDAGPGRGKSVPKGGDTKFDGNAKFYDGKGLQLPIPGSFATDHPTSGLEGYPANDFMAPAGTPVYAPVTGQVRKLSGHPGGTAGGAAGLSIYIDPIKKKWDDLFLTHFDWARKIVKPGQSVRRGQLIGYVMNYPGGAHHVHYGADL